MNDVCQRMLDNVVLPPLGRIQQHFSTECLEDPVAEVRRLFHQEWIMERLNNIKTVGITIGSREINHLPDMVRVLCDELRAMEIKPYLIPSMGSHGGATAEGQRKVIEELGFTEGFTGAEILSGMDVTKLGTTENGLEVYYDTSALALDGVIVMGRVKAHTDITGDIESGLHKMIVVGLGNQKGADVMHAAGLDRSVPRIKEIAHYCLNHGNILFGIAIAENAYDDTFLVEYIPPEMIPIREPQILADSKKRLAQFLFNDIDVLIVDYIGKNISGDGMDPNIIGRSMIGYKNTDIRIDMIVTLALTPEAMGSGVGVGLSDVTTERLFRAMDLDASYTNSITALAYAGSRIPLIMNNDSNAVRCACRAAQSKLEPGESLRVVRIRDTLHLGEIWVSPSILEEVRNDPRFTVVEEAKPMSFDKNGSFLLS